MRAQKPTASLANSMQTFSRTSVLGLKIGALAVLLLGVGALVAWRTAIALRPPLGSSVEQIIPFSHQHHVGDDGIDCRFCHAGAETEAFAGIPSLATCMSCHSQLFTDAPLLGPLRASFAGRSALRWSRVNDLPDFIYFDHSIHVNKGVGCSTCHGPIDRMPLTQRVASLRMQWCVDCHRAPERALRPRAAIYDLHWVPPPNQLERGRALKTQYHLHGTELLTACSTCHR